MKKRCGSPNLGRATVSPRGKKGDVCRVVTDVDTVARRTRCEIANDMFSFIEHRRLPLDASYRLNSLVQPEHLVAYYPFDGHPGNDAPLSSGRYDTKTHHVIISSTEYLTTFRCCCSKCGELHDDPSIAIETTKIYLVP